MHGVYDWVTVLLFGAIATLFLQRSVGRAVAGDRVLAYLPPALGCAIANYLGNSGWHLPALLLLAATIAYILVRLRPWIRG
ncbi:XrtV sorting system accessory protein [Sphingomonas sp. MMS12-HWE2-04]|uniref:XrtV sorting system accessory protein n=1 Tax=Sphingomonas sp. MMS12-HWE2-04 TaxID=3234199 RepID=UPI0038510727